MEQPEHIWLLIARSLSGEATSEESDELAALLLTQPHLLPQVELMRRLWNNEPIPEENTSPAKISRILQISAVEQAIQTPLQNEILPVTKKPLRKTIIALVSILVFATLGIIYLFKSPNKPQLQVVAQKGTKIRAILPDGSTVILNAGSRIEYDPSFDENIREVTLFGEAFFDVVKNPDRPFIVHAGNINIRVLGTSFNVKSYPEDNNVETTLIKGLVQITHSDDTSLAPIYLQPNQKMILPASIHTDETTALKIPAKDQYSKAIVAQLDTTLLANEHIETAWIYNRLQFRGDTFSDLAKKLERWYNITIHFQDESAKKLMFNGSIQNETVEQAFIALQTAVPFDFKIEKNEIFITAQ